MNNYHIVLEAAPALSLETIHSDSMTYLNQGQCYHMTLNSHDNRYVTTTLVLTFHEERHRMQEYELWSCWATHQPHANVFDIILHQSVGIYNLHRECFNRISFQWKQQAVLGIQFNCLSTDFTYAKGVKGIALSLTALTEGGCLSSKIRLFRDKGSERKHREDARQLQKYVNTHIKSPAYTQLL
ncbi:CP2 transcription factor [Pilobolus umbonatus]|nr:CP2 transcription factor [Pilobolus umbonatus]